MTKQRSGKGNYQRKKNTLLKDKALEEYMYHGKKEHTSNEGTKKNQLCLVKLVSMYGSFTNDQFEFPFTLALHCLRKMTSCI